MTPRDDTKFPRYRAKKDKLKVRRLALEHHRQGRSRGAVIAEMLALSRLVDFIVANGGAIAMFVR
jgi:hypothetical protein